MTMAATLISIAVCLGLLGIAALVAMSLARQFDNHLETFDEDDLG